MLSRRAMMCDHSIDHSVVWSTTLPVREYHSTTPRGIASKNHLPSVHQDFGCGAHAHTDEGATPLVLQEFSLLGRSCTDRIPGESGMDRHRARMQRDKSWGVGLVCWESRKRWQAVTSGKSGKTSCRRQADQCSKVITDVNHFSDTPLEEAIFKKEKGVRVPYVLDLNQGWEYDQGWEI